MQSRQREWGIVVLLALVPALPLLLGSGLVNTRAGGDSPFLLLRVHELVQNLRAGVFPARWMPRAAYGLGYPFFNFYASLPYYVGASFELAGVGHVAAIKLTQALGFIFAAIACYGFTRELQPQKNAANLLVALAYSCAPFHMVNVYVRGDSLSEFYAFVFYPLILWGLLRMHKRADTASLVWVALSYAGLVATHNISALIFSPFVVLYSICLAWKARDVMGLLRSLLALGTGLAASAWYWVPALAERGNVYLRDMTTGYFHYAQHFRGWDLVQSSLIFDYAITADQHPFRMGLLQALLAVAGCVAIAASWLRQRRVKLLGVYAIALLALSTFMITPLSRLVWERIPLLPLVQFPWRFLSVQALATSLVVANLVPDDGDKRTGTAHVVQSMVAPVIGLLILGSALPQLHVERLWIDDADVTTQRLMLYEYFTANVGTTIRTDYLPAGVDPRPYTSEAFWQTGTKPAPLAVEGQLASADLTSLGPTSEHWTIEATSDSLLAFNTYYYPGWRARIDGRDAQIKPLLGLGYIGLRVPSGRHEVQLQLGRTRVQWVAEATSAFTVIALLAMLAFSLRRQHSIAVAAVVWGRAETTQVTTKNLSLAVLALMLFLAAVVFLRSSQVDIPSVSGPSLRRTSAQQSLDLTMDFDRMPYLHHNPDGVRFGDAVRLVAYEVSSETVQADETLAIIAHWAEINRDDLVVRVALVSPAQHLFGVPLAVAASEHPLVDTRGQHLLHVPKSTMRGVYLLSIKVHGPEGELQPVNFRGETLGTTYLVPIRIENHILASGNEPIILQFGDRIELSQVETVQPAPSSLEARLTWRVSESPRQNYKTALRLRDPSGREVARLDTQPGYGFHPTSMWRAGELIHDRYVLGIDDGTPPGTQYSLDVTLYEATTLAPIGTTRMPGVSITHPTVHQDYAELHAFEDTLVLSRAQFSEAQLEQGDELSLALTWAARTQMEKDYECRVTLIPRAGVAVDYQQQPLAREYPTSLWPQNAVINQHYELQLAREIPIGEYSIELTVIDASSGETAGSFTLPDAIRITETTRKFTIPEMQVSVGADFAKLIRLLGYDLQREGSRLHLKLHWQALSAMTTDYKIFVHLFDPQTETIVAQEDILAGGDANPTSQWVAEEVVSDEIALRLEAVSDGVYHLGVGLYHADTRLPSLAPAGFTVSADRLLLQEGIHVP